MFDYIDQMKLALGDTVRRAAMKSGGGVAMAIGAGFLIAALWSWIALYLGSIYASLIVGGIFAFVGLVIWLMATSRRYKAPTTDDLRNEVETRIGLVTDAAMNKVRHTAESAVDGAQARVASIFGGAGRRVSGLAKDAEGVASDAIEAGGEALKGARETLDRAVETKAGPAIGIAGAFALGMVIAGAFSARRDKEDLYYDDYDYDYDYDYDDWDDRRY